MTSDALGERAPTEAELDLAYKLACEANCKAAIYWQNYVSTGDHQGIFEPLSKLAIELTKALDRTPHVAGWLIQCNGTKEPPLEIGGREFSTAHHAALECVCRVVDGVISETRPNPHRKFDRRCFIGWNWEKLEKRITREYLRAIEALPKGKRKPPDAQDGPFGLSGFRWGRLKPRDGLPSTPFKLLTELWNANDRTSHFRDLAKVVWDDGEMNLRNDNQLGSARRAINRFMEAGAFPFRVRTSPKNEVVSLIESTAQPITRTKLTPGKKARRSPRPARQ